MSIIPFPTRIARCSQGIPLHRAMFCMGCGLVSSYVAARKCDQCGSRAIVPLSLLLNPQPEPPEPTPTQARPPIPIRKTHAVAGIRLLPTRKPCRLIAA
jgi:hypothetical protein